MPLLPIVGHDATRTRLLEAVRHDRLPASLLLHGPSGIGKERLGLWLGQALLCAALGPDGPCGACQHCQYVLQGAHPDLQWYVPRPRLKKADPDHDEVIADIAEGIGERLEGTDRKAPNALWPPDSGKHGYFLATVKALTARAQRSAALAARRVILVPDAELMVVQAGNDQAANAFLKLLEEPPATTTIVITSSEPAALLPTIRSRCASVRIPVLTQDASATFLALPVVATALDAAGVPAGAARRAQLAAGQPGRLLGGTTSDAAQHTAQLLLDAARGTPVSRYEAAVRQGIAEARGPFSDALAALTVLLRDEAEHAARAGRDDVARRSAEAIARVERARAEAFNNITPSLTTVSLLNDLALLLR